MRKNFTFILLLGMCIAVGLCSCGSSGNDARKNSDVETVETEVEEGYSQDEASLTGGYYIRNANDRYIPLAKGQGLDDVIDDSIVTSDTETSPEVPTIHDGEELVLFTDIEINEEKKRTVFDVLQEGYTIPLYYNGAYNVYELNDQWGYIGYNPKIDNIDGVDIEQFKQNHMISAEDFCKAEHGWRDWGRCDESMLPNLFTFDEPKDVTVGYYDGSTYQEIMLKAAIKYYAYDSCSFDPDETFGHFRGNKVTISLTKNGYAVVDVDSLGPGTYIAKEADDEEYLLSGADHIAQCYVFKKE